MQIATSYFMRLQYATGNKVFGTIPTQFLQIATRFVEDADISNITHPGASGNPQRSELWQSRDSGIGTSEFEESMGFQVRCDMNKICEPLMLILYKGLQFPIHNGFEFQDTDFWLTESGVLSFLESNRDFGLPNPISEGSLVGEGQESTTR
jgi:hypothetical protein